MKDLPWVRAVPETNVVPSDAFDTALFASGASWSPFITCIASNEIFVSPLSKVCVAYTSDVVVDSSGCISISHANVPLGLMDSVSYQPVFVLGGLFA